MLFIEQYSLIIAIGLLVGAFIIFKKPHFTFQRRMVIVMGSISILLLAYYFGPSLGFTIDITNDLPEFLFLTIGNAFIADAIFKQKR